MVLDQLKCLKCHNPLEDVECPTCGLEVCSRCLPKLFPWLEGDTGESAARRITLQILTIITPLYGTERAGEMANWFNSHLNQGAKEVVSAE